MLTAGRVARGAAVAVVVVAGAAGVVLAVEAGIRAAEPRPAGAAPWIEATAASRTARSLTVLADVGTVRRGSCDRLAGRPVVTESPSAVRIRVEVVAQPAPQGRVCSLQYQARLPVAVRLTAPIGTRTPVDATDGATRPLRVGRAAPDAPR